VTKVGIDEHPKGEPNDAKNNRDTDAENQKTDNPREKIAARSR